MTDGRIEANKKRCKISDEELIEVCKTMTINEIAERYGMHHAQVRRRCRINGLKPIGYGNPNYRSITMSNVNARGLRGHGGSDPVFGECWHYIASQDKMCKSKHPDFEYIETRNKNGSSRIRLKCKTCKTIIERAGSTVRQRGIECEFCKEQNKLKEERVRLMRFFYALTESKKTKYCVRCGAEFYSQCAHAKYCSPKCKNKAKSKYSSIRKRCRKYGVLYDPSVKPLKVFERDKYICKICGMACNKEDDTWNGYMGAYSPTVDHIVALANGGTHTWDNVQCAHAICNSYKRDLITV